MHVYIYFAFHFMKIRVYVFNHVHVCLVFCLSASFLVHVRMFIVSVFHYYLQNNNFITSFHVFLNVKIFKVHVRFIKENYIVCMIASTF